MKLGVKVLDLPTGRKLVMVDEAGEMLPGQVEVAFVNAVGERGRVTATFDVDGEDVSLQV